MRGPRRSTPHHYSEEFLRSSPNSYNSLRTKLSLYAKNCEICEAKPAKYVCRLCHRYVCEDHFNKRLDICVVCTEALCDVCRNNIAIGHCAVCGRKVCHSCSIEIDEVRRICYYCVIRYGVEARNMIVKSIKNNKLSL